jgi:hypothetical protein
MKFLMMMIPRVYQPSTPADERAGEGFAPPADAVAEMGKFNEELARAGTIIDIDGLYPLAKGARVSFGKGKPVVTDGPYIESKEVIGGYWIVELKSKEEAVEWAQRCPAAEGDVIEIRPIYEFEDLPGDVQQAANR